VRPDLIVVFDRVESTQARFRKTWLLHSVEEPQMLAEKCAFQVEYGEGRLVCLPVLPLECTAGKIGGPGREFLVAGVALTLGGVTAAGVTLEYGEIPGAWRVELSPATEAERDCFLNVLLTADRGTSIIPDVEVVADDDAAVSLRVRTPHGTEAEFRFAKTGAPSARLMLTKDGRVVFRGDMPDELVQG
jgi:hypothetical protein